MPAAFTPLASFISRERFLLQHLVNLGLHVRDEGLNCHGT